MKKRILLLIILALLLCGSASAYSGLAATPISTPGSVAPVFGAQEHSRSNSPWIVAAVFLLLGADGAIASVVTRKKNSKN